MRRLSVCSVALIAVVASSGTAGPATAKPKDDDGRTDSEIYRGKIVADTATVTVRRSDGWISFEYKDKLANPKKAVYEGKRDHGSCLFSGSRIIESDSDAVSVEREIATNSAECRMVTEVGEMPEANLDLGESRDGIREREDAPAGDNEGGVAQRASRHAWHRTRHQDPPQIDCGARDYEC